MMAMQSSSAAERLKSAKKILEYCGARDFLSRDREQELYALFQDASSPSENPLRLINDAIHGPVELSSLAYKIINTPEFHRLKDIKQLGGSNYVYPGANHTRFDHSIGVYYLTGVFAKHLQQQLKMDTPVGDSEELHKWKFTNKEVLCAEIAGLCHDLGHGPLSHMFERHILKSLTNLKHENLSITILQQLLAKNTSVLVEFVSEGLGVEELKLIELMIKPQKEVKLSDPWKNREFLCEIVANKKTGMDVDKWDYYARDCHYLGMTNDFQQRRCMMLGRIVKASDGDLHIAFRDKELDNIYGMFRTRGILHQKAYQHKTVKAVERMIADAIIAVKDVKIFTVFGSHQPKSVADAIQEVQEKNIDTFLGLTDSIIGIIKCFPISEQEPTTPVERLAHRSLATAKELLRRIEVRDLYSCSWKVRVPKMLPAHQEAESPHPNGDDNQETESPHPNGDGSSQEIKSPHPNGRLWRAMEAMKLQPGGESIHTLLDETTRARIDVNRDLWVEFEMIEIPSEGTDNPVKAVLFYKKSKGKNQPPVVLTESEVNEMTSMLVVPQAFVECEIRVYDKRKMKDRSDEDKESIKKALLQWKKQADEQSNGSM